MKNFFIITAIVVAYFLYFPNEETLKDKFENDFLIGATINQEDYQIVDRDAQAIKIVQKDFNAVTPENSMKWMHIHPEFNEFTFSNADKIVDFAKENEMYLLGHTLVWHNQVPDYIYNIKDKRTFQDHIEEHINTVVKRYQGKVDMWDVVNEALNDDGSLRKTVFLEMLGENYIEQAFSLANKADPNVALAYNDYNLYKPKKRKGQHFAVNTSVPNQWIVYINKSTGCIQTGKPFDLKAREIYHEDRILVNEKTKEGKNAFDVPVELLKMRNSTLRFEPPQPQDLKDRKHFRITEFIEFIVRMASEWLTLFKDCITKKENAK